MIDLEFFLVIVGIAVGIDGFTTYFGLKKQIERNPIIIKYGMKVFGYEFIGYAVGGFIVWFFLPSWFSLLFIFPMLQIFVGIANIKVIADRKKTSPKTLNSETE